MGSSFKNQSNIITADRQLKKDLLTFHHITPLPRRSRSLGFSLLEFSVALPIVLSVMVGAFDISQVLHANSVARESVETALRCMYATDSACQSVAPGTRQALYDIERTKVAVTDTAMLYSGDYAQMEGPTTTFAATATVLSGGTATVGQSQLGITGSHLAQTVDYLLLGDTVFGGLRFTGTPRDTTSSRSADMAQTFKGTRLSRDGQTDNTPTFSFSNGTPGMAQLATGRGVYTLNGGILTPNTSLSSAATPIIFKIYGKSVGNEACASVALDLLEYKDGNSAKATGLGGQFVAPQADQDANFFLRGAPDGTVKKLGPENTLDFDSSADNERQEFISYHYQTVDLSKTYAIKLTMQDRSGESYVDGQGKTLSCPKTGSIGWQASRVEFWLPKVTSQHETVACKNITSTCTADKHTCVPESDKYDANFQNIKTGEPITTKEIRCSQQGSASDAYAGFSNECKEAACHDSRNLVATVQDAQAITFSCPENKGVSSMAEAASICPAPPAAVGLTTATVRWDESSKDLGASVYKRASCDEPAPTTLAINPEWSSYPKLSTKAIAHGTYRFGAGRENENRWNEANDPAVLKRTDPRYTCGDFTPTKKAINTLHVPPGSSFSSAQPISCSMPDHESLRAEVAALPEVGSDSYIVTNQAAAAGMVAVASCPACGSCSYAPSASPEIIARSLPYGQFPAECSDEGVSCKATFVGFSAGTATTSVADQLQAIANAENQMKVFLPWMSNFDCPSASNGAVPRGCPSIKIDDQALASNGIVNVTSEIQVPTISGALFASGENRDSFKVSYSDSRVVEKSFTR